jgi:hypothetical protein
MLWSEWSSRYERQCGLKGFRPEVGGMIPDGRLRWLGSLNRSYFRELEVGLIRLLITP